METGDKLVTLDGLKFVYDGAVAPGNTVTRLYPFDVSGDTVIYNDANNTTPVYSLNPIVTSGQTIGAGIKYLHIVTDRAERFYVHGLYSQNANGLSTVNIHCFDDVSVNLLLMQVEAANDPNRDANGVGTYTFTSSDGGTTVKVIIDWNLVNRTNWTAGGSGESYKPVFRDLVTISEACVDRAPLTTAVDSRVDALEEAVAVATVAEAQAFLAE